MIFAIFVAPSLFNLYGQRHPRTRLSEPSGVKYNKSRASTPGCRRIPSRSCF
jgi:hypothetical protein